MRHLDITTVARALASRIETTVADIASKAPRFAEAVLAPCGSPSPAIPIIAATPPDILRGLSPQHIDQSP